MRNASALPGTLLVALFASPVGASAQNTTAPKPAPEKPDVDPYFRESSSISSNTGPQVITRNILQDSKGGFWLAFSGGTLKGQDPKPSTSVLNRFDPAGGLENILAASKQFEVKGGRGIFGLTEDKDGNIWFGTGRGIGRIDGDTVQYY